jgi:hypothetical protein
MERVTEQRRGRRHFDNPAEIHYCRAVGNIAHYMQIMADVDIRQGQLPLQVP